LIKQKL